MGKTKKKRNKQYRGIDAAMTQPKVVKVQAVSRSRFGQWWFDKKKIIKVVAIIAAVLFVVTIVIIEIVQLFRGA